MRPLAARLIPLCLILLAAAARAQDPQNEAEQPGRAVRGQAQQARASGEASKLDAADGEGVSYEAILAHPDDMELNYRFARSQVKRGDLKGAAATLERIMLIDPNRSDARLFYAVVLYRLDNMVEAERELDILKGLNLPDPMGSEVKQYRSLVAKRRKKNHLSGRLGVGLEYDSNRNAAPTSGSLLFFDTPLPLSGNSKRQDDFSKLFIGGVDLKRDLGAHQAFASVNYYRAEQNLVKTLNLQAYSVQGGISLAHGRDTLTPTLVFDHVLLDQSTYLRDRGLDVRYEHKAGARADVFVQVHDVFEDFVPTQAIPTASERTGIHLDNTLGGDVVITPTLRVGAGVLYGVKHAAQHYNAFYRYGTFYNAVWLPGRGTFAITTLNWNFDTYLQPDPLVSAALRRDENARWATTFGAPLSLLHHDLSDFVATLTYEYYHGGSNIQNFAYFNHKVSALVTYKWDIGF